MNFVNVSQTTGYLIAKRLATLYELQTVYDLEDALDMIEAVQVCEYNEYMEAKNNGGRR